MVNNDFDITGMNVLIVDDTPANIDVLRTVLTAIDLNISAAPNGEVALKIVPGVKPDLILLDIMMPGLDGYETCEKLKSDPSTKEIPIIFISAKNDPSDIVKGFLVGGLDYIKKPFIQEEVLIRVKTQLQLRIKTKKLNEALMELERSNQDLQAFASVASHDLKTPLRHIKNLGGIVRNDYADLLDEEGKDLICKMVNMATQMSQMIDGILQFSQVERDPKPFQSIDLKELIQRVVNNLQEPIMETKGVIHIGDLPIVKGDPILLFQLFQNLIANALKFHRNEIPPIINIHGRSNGDRFCEIIVEDNGIGFDEKDADKIFLPLKRLVSRNQYEGSGIGLATCKKIAHHHKGTITCQSQIGKGTKFIINIPEFVKTPMRRIILTPVSHAG